MLLFPNCRICRHRTRRATAFPSEDPLKDLSEDPQEDLSEDLQEDLSEDPQEDPRRISSLGRVFFVSLHALKTVPDLFRKWKVFGKGIRVSAAGYDLLAG